MGSKHADAHETDQIIGAIVLGAFLNTHIAVDKEQRVRASLVTRPLNRSQTTLRVTFQRMAWNTDNQISRVESLEEPELYHDFFGKLSKAVFLEAHEI